MTTQRSLESASAAVTTKNLNTKKSTRTHLGPPQRDEEHKTRIDPRPRRRVAYGASGSVTSKTPILYSVFAEVRPFYH